MNYQEYTKKRQDDFNKLPIFYAFSNEQFREAMAARGLSEADTDKLYRLGRSGGFYLKTDAPLIKQWADSDCLMELMRDKDFAVDAFYYELSNHEYAINWQGDYDVCNIFVRCEYGEEKTFSDYFKEAGHPELIPFFAIALRKYAKTANY